MKKPQYNETYYITMVNTFCQFLGPLLNRCSTVMTNSLNKKNCWAKQAEQWSSSFFSLPALFSLAYFSVRSLAPSCTRTSHKRAPKMQRLSGCLWKVVLYENQTTGGLFKEEVQAHLLYGR